MKKVHLFISTILVASFLVACSDDKSSPPAVVLPGTPAPITPAAGDGFITWQSESWNGNITHQTRFAEMLTFGNSGTTQCGTDGYYPATGHRYFFGNQDCEYYTRQAYIVLRYNPTTNIARLYVYGMGNNGLYAGFSRETTASDQSTGFSADFGPLSTNGTTPDHISSFKVYAMSPITSSSATQVPVEIRFGPAPSGDVVATDNLIRVN